MRDRLIELHKQAFLHLLDTGEPFTHENYADYLLANGVIVPPYKVGDVVYSFVECSCENIDGVHTECEFYGYGEDDRICAIPCGAKCPYQHRIEKCYVTESNLLMFTRQWGKTVFLTKEEAEQALEKMKGEKE